MIVYLLVMAQQMGKICGSSVENLCNTLSIGYSQYLGVNKRVCIFKENTLDKFWI
jgi:hypothetical protein